MPYDPIAQLMEEHQRFLGRLRDYRLVLAPRATPTAAGSDLGEQVLDFAGFLDVDVNRFHGRKEEEGLFPVLGRHLPIEGGPVGVMIAEHRLLGEQQGILIENARKVSSDPGAGEARRAIVGSSRTIEALLTAHIDKEDQVLFPMARELL